MDLLLVLKTVEVKKIYFVKFGQKWGGGEVTCHNVLYIYIQRVYPEKVMNFQMRKPVKRCAHVEAVSAHTQERPRGRNTQKQCF